MEIVCLYSKDDSQYELKIKLIQDWFKKNYCLIVADEKESMSFKLDTEELYNYDISIVENGIVFNLTFIELKELSDNDIANLEADRIILSDPNLLTEWHRCKLDLKYQHCNLTVSYQPFFIVECIYRNINNSENKMENNSVLLEADKIVNGERHVDYGSSKESFDRISKMASIMTSKELSPEDCIKVLISVKMVRESFKHKRDNLVDACGYIELLNQINK